MILLVNNQENNVVIPKEAIRFRVIANSDKTQDQKLKKQVATSLRKDLSTLLRPGIRLEEARSTLKGKLPELERTIQTTIEQEKETSTYQIDYGNHYFPEKSYRGVVYEAGMYESLVVTLGKGEGQNFWCVLFPPLCLLEAEEEEETTDVEYKSFVKEIIDKYFL